MRPFTPCKSEGRGSLAESVAVAAVVTVAGREPVSPAADAQIENAALDVSQLALRYAASWHDERTAATTSRLYRFNSAPRSPAHMRVFNDAVSARQYLIRAATLGCSESTGPFRLSTDAARGWLSWRNADVRSSRTLASTRKVYITAKLDCLPRALNAVFWVARNTDVPVLKFGADYSNLRRPDRIVMYTRDREHAEEIADALRSLLHDIAADALPFAECLSAAVFTGLDPPVRLPIVADGPRSWRGWLCHSLAQVLSREARHDPDTAVGAALMHARSLAIDPSSWAVRDNFFEVMAGVR